MQKVFDITSIRQKYPNRWLLLIIYSYEDEQPVSGRVLAYSKSRTKVYDARTRLRTHNSDLDLRIVFTGDQEELDKVSPELDLSLAMAEGESHALLASFLFAEDMEKALSAAELKKKQISDLERIYKEQNVPNISADWHNAYQFSVEKKTVSNQAKASDENVVRNRKKPTDE